MFRQSNFDKNLENATSHLRLEPDWPSILLICDAIRQNDVTPKQAFGAIKKKMTSQNPHSAFYALLVLESVVKNCGSPMHEEIFTKENCEMFNTFLEETSHENVRQKMLELVQTWAFAFRSSEKYQAIKDTMTILKTKGHNFPELKEADAMFTADTAPDWADGKVCHRCRVEFTFTQRKHHCRNCGQIFCSQCSAKQCPLPKFGIEKEVRVCDGCYSNLQKPSAIKRNTQETDLPVEYLNSTLAQQPQKPARKSDEELKEEEELQLALALSQSEAEQKSNKNVYSSVQKYQPVSRTEESIANDFPAPINIEEPATDPDLAKYLNRSYWEQKKMTQSPASPSAPSPMPQLLNMNNINMKQGPTEDDEIDDFAVNMKSQVEIFVNRMKSNSSRGRNISNDSSVQTLFMNLTSLHSQLLTYIKQMDDKRMWCERLQDKLAQVKDSRAALDVLRQEHLEKIRRAAEEQERQRQLQMKQKLETMRKKKQEYLQYQRQLALRRIQEQEREMQLRQEQQKAQYRIGQTQYPYMPPQPIGPAYNPYTYNNGMQHFPNPPQLQQVQGIPQSGGPEVFLPTQQQPQPQHNMNFPGQTLNTTQFIPNNPNPIPNFVEPPNIQGDKVSANISAHQMMSSNFPTGPNINQSPMVFNPGNNQINPDGIALNVQKSNENENLNYAMPINSNSQQSVNQATNNQPPITQPQPVISAPQQSNEKPEVSTAELIKFD